VIKKGVSERTVFIPEGKWKSYDGKIISGPVTIKAEAGLNQLPYYEKID
jgi:alpha-glucosidase (family GH31 glycosyl hydrolase)